MRRSRSTTSPACWPTRISRTISPSDFDLGDGADLWHFRRVEYPIPAIPILDFYDVLKGRLLAPRGSFWEIRPFSVVDQLAKGMAPQMVGAPSDPELSAAYQHLRELVLKRAEKLDQNDWEDVQFCFVSVYGFTPTALAKAEAEGIRLLEAGDFTRFLLGGRVRDRLREKLALPSLEDIGDEG
jgi:hypothetical protein